MACKPWSTDWASAAVPLLQFHCIHRSQIHDALSKSFLQGSCGHTHTSTNILIPHWFIPNVPVHKTMNLPICSNTYGGNRWRWSDTTCDMSNSSFAYGMSAKTCVLIPRSTNVLQCSGECTISSSILLNLSYCAAPLNNLHLPYRIVRLNNKYLQNARTGQIAGSSGTE